MSPKRSFYETAKAIKIAKRTMQGKQGYVRRQKCTVPKKIPYLPNKDYPIIFRILTRSELDAIPRDRYDITVIKAIAPLPETGGKKTETT